MPLDPRMKSAILEATEAAGQDGTLAKKIFAWFEALNSGNENIQDREATARRVEMLYGLTKEGDVTDDEEGEE